MTRTPERDPRFVKRHKPRLRRRFTIEDVPCRSRRVVFGAKQNIPLVERKPRLIG